MEQLDSIISTLSMTMGVAWASGLNLYAALLTLGVLGATGNMALPPDLQILSNPLVMVAAGCMFAVEFVADKIPGVDSTWDSVHTFVRIPAGAMLAAGAVGDVDPVVSLAAGILGGGLAAGTHATKAGSRVLINTSPEPITNWFASLGEDVAVVVGIWAALKHPIVFIVAIVLFIALMIWLLPKIWKGIKKVFAFIGRLFGVKDDPPGMASAGAGVTGVNGTSTNQPPDFAASSPFSLTDSDNDEKTENTPRLPGK